MLSLLKMMEAAYSNVGLDANATWREGPGDDFQKCSDKLWVKLNYLRERKHYQVGEKGKTVTVRDVIPQSRLARYGNYAYDNDRESVYCGEKRSGPLDDRPPVPRNERETEPWMLPEVELEFLKLTRNGSRPYDLYNGFRPVELVEVEESIGKKYPVLAKKCQPNFVDSEETLETIRLPNPFYRIEDLNQLELQMRITSTKHIWERRSKIFCDPSVRTEEAEEKGKPLAMPSGPASSLPAARSPRFAESPFRNPDPGNSRTRVGKGVSTDRRDFPDLSVLTRPGDPQKVPDAVVKWLHTGYPTRCKEFRAVQTLANEFRNLKSAVGELAERERTEKYGSDFRSETADDRFLEALTRQAENSNVSRRSSSGSERRRSSPFSNLTYSPISSASLPESSSPYKSPSESNFRGNGYDDLERQAIEQWPSDESLQ